jgi:hypothetical protein
MSCENVQERISLLLDGRLPHEDREGVLAHTDSCRQCGTLLEALEHQQSLLRNMVQPELPATLVSKLQVIASHERERKLASVSWSERIRRASGWVQLHFDNMMRPVALPFTGGILSTLLIFAVLMPTLSFSHPSDGYEFRTLPQGRIVTNPWEQGVEADLKDFPMFGPPGESNSDYMNVVNLTIDEYGKVEGWDVVRGRLTDEMNSIILFGRFIPATTMGINTWGVIQVRQTLPPCKYTRCSVTVRG